MKNIKSTVFIFIGILLFLVICGVTFYYFENYEAIYYTKIDNTKIKSIPGNDDMKYEYILDSYDDKGHKKSISFKTVRELKNAAYLKLEVKLFGVHKWEEVKWENLPLKVQAKLK